MLNQYNKIKEDLLATIESFKAFSSSRSSFLILQELKNSSIRKKYWKPYNMRWGGQGVTQYRRNHLIVWAGRFSLKRYA